MTRENDLIRALAEDLALEILASYTAEDYRDADFTSLGLAAVYLEEHGGEPGPALLELVVKIRTMTVSPSGEAGSAPEPPVIGEP